jgi:multidrug resistance efflux pump
LAYHLDADGDVMFNINRSCIGLMAGVNYKLPNSDGSRHQRCGRLRSQQEIDQLNQQVNELRAELKAKEAQQARDARLIKELKDKLDQLNDRSTPGFGIGD